MLQCLRAKGYPWDEKMCAEAAMHGYLEVVQYLHANGCQWDEEACWESVYSQYVEPQESRAKGGRGQIITMMKWFHLDALTTGRPSQWRADVCEFMARERDLEMLQWHLTTTARLTIGLGVRRRG